MRIFSRGCTNRCSLRGFQHGATLTLRVGREKKQKNRADGDAMHFIDRGGMSFSTAAATFFERGARWKAQEANRQRARAIVHRAPHPLHREMPPRRW
jgi:hypothetical protein